MEIKGKILRGYIKKYPEMKKLTLAKLVYKENPSIWLVKNC
jgi:hypothetical protein